MTVDTAGGPLVIAATHLTSDHTERGHDRRAVELTRLAEGLAGIEAGDVTLLGDFNDGRSGAGGPAAALGLRDAWNDAHGADDRTPTFDPVANPLAAVGSLSGLAGRIDRILLRSARARVAQAGLRGNSPSPDGLFISDHYGVEVTLDFGPAADGPGGSGAVGAGGSGADGPGDSGTDAAHRHAVLDAPATARTALAWLAPPDAAVDALRQEHDPQAERWPAHVNLLFGFVPESSFGAALPLLAEAASRTAAFTARLDGVHSFGPTLWLDPAASGEAPWQELRRALTARFPGCRGRGEGYTPHLTLGRSADPVRAERRFAARLGGGRPARVGSLAVLSRRGDGPMEVRATVELGTGRIRWAPEPLRPEAAMAAGAESVTARIAAALPEGVVHVAGSRRMGCALPDADLDLVAALPGAASTAEVRARIASALPEAEGLREVTGARVPGLRLRVAGLDVDLVLVATGPVPPDGAVARRARIGEAAAVALSAVSDADAVREFAGPERAAAFARLAREVKVWARSRGLDSAPFGGLPGLAWAVLAAHTVRAAPDLSPGPLLRTFFATWAAWDWRAPVTLSPAPDPTSAATTGADPAPAPAPAPASYATAGPVSGAGAVTVLTPSAPVRSCTTQVGAGTADLLARELYAAWEVLEEDSARELPAARPPLHRRHAAWAVVTVTGARPGEFEENLGRTRGRLRSLLGALEEAGCSQAHAWPRPYERTATLARYAIGLGSTPPDATALARLGDPWSATVPGTEVTWAAGGDVPDLS